MAFRSHVEIRNCYQKRKKKILGIVNTITCFITGPLGYCRKPFEYIGRN